MPTSPVPPTRSAARTWVRRGVSAGLASAVVLAATALPALAETIKRDDGDEPGDPMTLAQGFGLFVLVPLAIIAVISLLVLAPSWTRSGRNGTGLESVAEPVWVHGPAALAAGSDRPALPAGAGGSDADQDEPTGGGISARW
ncbi:MAG: hypothetical protein R2737_05630 [Candidatus Nanopelagicales bacterium]